MNIRLFLYLKLFPKAECYIKRHKPFKVKEGKIMQFCKESAGNHFLKIPETGQALDPREEQEE